MDLQHEIREYSWRRRFEAGGHRPGVAEFWRRVLWGRWSIAIGLSLAFGIMRLVNIAHGDLIVLCAYVAMVGSAAFLNQEIVCQTRMPKMISRIAKMPATIARITPSTA